MNVEVSETEFLQLQAFHPTKEKFVVVALPLLHYLDLLDHAAKKWIAMLKPKKKWVHNYSNRFLRRQPKCDLNSPDWLHPQSNISSCCDSHVRCFLKQNDHWYWT